MGWRVVVSAMHGMVVDDDTVRAAQGGKGNASRCLWIGRSARLWLVPPTKSLKANVQRACFGLDAQCLWRCLVCKRTGSRGKNKQTQSGSNIS